MIKIISFKICPFVQRVTALLEAKKVAYELEYISLSDIPPWFREISPNGQVPVLLTESGQALFESDAIVEYLDEVYPPLEPGVTPEQRALDRAWSYQGAQQYLPQCSAQRSADKDTLSERVAKLGKAFAKAENILGDGPYFKGEALSNVDIAWLPLLHRAALIETGSGFDFLDGYPKVKAWQTALMETGIAEKSVAEDFDEAFNGFYLSDETFLGTGKCNKDIPGGGGCGDDSCCQ